MFETASFHITKPCNMKCKFCYATFEDFHVGPMMNINVAKNIVEKLKEGGLEKITFAGGEPLLYKKLPELIEYSKTIGLTTSIITNGSLLSNKFLQENQEHLDWIGVSIDSLDRKINELIGRDPDVNYHRLVENIKQFGYKLKINTVVNIFNQYELLAPFILWAEAERWKVFDTLRVEGQNDEQFELIRSSPTGFDDFVIRNKISAMVPENNEAMTGSYLLIDPIGRLFENSEGKHTYSSPLQNSTLDKCLAEIKLNREMFEHRGGIYKW